MNPTHVYAGVTRWGGGGSQAAQPDTLGGVFRLRLGDSSWEHVTAGFPEMVHAHCVTVHPEAAEIVFAGTQDGVFRSDDFGTSWRRMEFEPRNRQIWSIAIDPSNSRRMFAGASPIGIFASEDGGSTWSDIPSAAAPDKLEMGSFKNRVMRITVDPGDSSRLCAAMEVNGAMASDDGGRRWEDRSRALLRLAEEPRLKSKILTDSEQEGMLDAHAVCILPTGDRAAYLANRMGIFKSLDNGRTWADVQVGRFSQFAYGRDIRASISEPGVLYAALSVSSRGDAGSVARSADGGATWSRFDRDVEAKSTVTAIAQHPGRGEIVFFSARRGQVFGSQDAGRTWRDYPMPKECQGIYALACA